jgi:hypothetical protein
MGAASAADDAPDALSVSAAPHGGQHHPHPLLGLAVRAGMRLGNGAGQTLLENRGKKQQGWVGSGLVKAAG